METEKLQKIIIGFCALAFLAFGLEESGFTSFGRAEIRNDKLMRDAPVNSSKMTYGRFLDYLEMGWVKQVDLYDNSRNALVQTSSPELGNRTQVIRVDLPIGGSQLIEKLKEYDIDFDAHPIPKSSIILKLLADLLLPIVFVISLLYLFQDNFSSGNSPMNFGKSPAKFDPRPRTGVNFADIAGIDEAKAEFEELVSFLKEPERYTRVGARIPKGALLVGPPGTGKTLLAKAIANEAKVPFFNVAGSEFVEMFIGIGASRIRDLFNQAAENAPCIVFIDEIDAVGRERGSGVGGGNDEREQTLNQLLTEMDGFRQNRGVIVVGATNRVDILDAALLRPGRFDREISVGLPDKLGRIDILKVHAKGKSLEKSISLVGIANRTPGFSGADLANLLNESAILTTRYERKKITQYTINEAINRILGGIAGSPMPDSKNKRLIAYHEIGHALTGSTLQHHDPVEKISLIPRGGAKGLTWFTPNEDQMLVSRKQLIARIAMTLSGRIAERFVFGETEITTGASNDLQEATRVARMMVTDYGMSALGPIALREEDITGEQANRVDREVRQIMNQCEAIAKKIVGENRLAMDLVIDYLLDYQELDGDEFVWIIEKALIVPPKLV